MSTTTLGGMAGSSMIILGLLILCIWTIEFLAIRYIAGKSLFASQLFRLIAGFVILMFCYYFNLVQNDFLNFGNISASVHPVYWLGIGEGENWISVSIGFLFSISFVTFLALYLPNKKTLERPKEYYIWIFTVLLLALNNALIEEILYRLIPLSVGTLPPATLAICSGVAFGIPHYFGYPSKWLGIILASFLGWFLAKSVLETQGVFLAFVFHWVQDILIISILSLSKNQSAYRGICSDKRTLIQSALPITISLILFLFLTYWSHS